MWKVVVVVVWWCLLASSPAQAKDPHRSYTLSQYDVPASVQTILFDLHKEGRSFVGTFLGVNKQHAFLSHPQGAITCLDVGDSLINFATAISSFGIVGSFENAAGKRIGAVWANKRKDDGEERAAGLQDCLPALVNAPTTVIDIEGYDGTFLLGLNDHGDLVGDVQKPEPDPTKPTKFRGLVISNGKVQFFDYPGAEQESTEAHGIRNDGTIVGTYTDGRIPHGFILHPDGIFETLDITPVCGTLITGTNDKGDLCGGYVDCSSGQIRGFVRTRQGQFIPIDFPGPGVILTQVNGLDDKGNFVGRFDDASGTHGLFGFLQKSRGENPED